MELENGQEDLRVQLRRKIDDGLAEIFSKPLGTLDQMEESVQRLQRDLAREALEGLIALKKTSSRQGSDRVARSVKGPSANNGD